MRFFLFIAFLGFPGRSFEIFRTWKGFLTCDPQKLVFVERASRSLTGYPAESGSGGALWEDA